jgi:hypothetical protein
MNARLGEDDIPDLNVTIVASTNKDIGRALVGEAHCIDWPESTWALTTVAAIPHHHPHDHELSDSVAELRYHKP